MFCGIVCIVPRCEAKKNEEKNKNIFSLFKTSTLHGKYGIGFQETEVVQGCSIFSF